MIRDFSLGPSFLTSQDLSRPSRERVDRLSKELASGKIADVARPLNSDFSEISRLTHRLSMYAAEDEAIGRAQTWGRALQASLTSIKSSVALIGDEIAVSLSAADNTGLENLAATAKGVADDVFAALNTTVAGRSIFANAARDSAVFGLDALLADIEGVAAGAADYDAYSTAVDTFFSPGGTFETTYALALDPDPATFSIGGGNSVAYEVHRASDEVVGALKQAVLVAALPQAGFSLDQSSRRSIAGDLQVRQATTTSNLASMEGKIGAVEQRIASQAETLEADRLSSEQRLGVLSNADPFETSIRLQEEMSRLETIYAITARRSRLRLTDFL